jgi:replicative DNA helicase
MEKAVVAAVLIDGNLYDSVRKLLPSTDYFWGAETKVIYEAYESLFHEKKAIDFLTVGEELKGKVSSGKLSEYISTIPEHLKFDSIKNHLTDYAKTLAELYAKRIIYQAVNAGRSMKEAMSAVQDVTKADFGKYFNSKDLARYYNEILVKKGQGGKMFFPFADLNNATLGMREGQFIIVASRPSIGKSSFLENIALFNAEKGFKTLFASAEMDAESLTTRILTRLSGIDLWKKKPTTPEELVAYDNATTKLKDAAFFLYDKGLMNVTDLESQIKKEQFDLVCVDYLSLVEPNAKYRSIYEKVTYASQQLKALAVEYKLTMAVASQYNRLADKTQPSLADLRDSGGIEQDADIVISLWTKQEDSEENGLTKVYMDVLKNRNGYTFINSATKEYFLWLKKEKTEFYDNEMVEKHKESELPF